MAEVGGPEGQAAAYNADVYLNDAGLDVSSASYKGEGETYVSM